MTARLAELIYFFAGVGWFLIRLPHQRRSRKVPVARSAGGQRDRMLLAGSLAGLAIIPIAYIILSTEFEGEPLPADRPFAPAIAWIGFGLVALSLLLFYLTHAQLGRNWSVTLDTRKTHQLVTTGVYARVRHPMYTAFWLLALSQAALIPNWIAGFSGIVGFATLFLLRVGREEQLMLETFGDDYRRYVERTARLVPWVY